MTDFLWGLCCGAVLMGVVITLSYLFWEWRDRG